MCTASLLGHFFGFVSMASARDGSLKLFEVPCTTIELPLESLIAMASLYLFSSSFCFSFVSYC